jgi:hypothetical protein
MSRGVSIQVEGLDKLKKKFGSIPENIRAEVDAEMAVTARDFVNRAVEAAPVDVGFLRGQITFNKVSEMNYEIVSGANYSAFIEFGTKSKVQIPAGLSSYAAQFKGKGTGNLDEFLRALTQWVKRKGIAASWSNWGQFHRVTRKRTKVSEAFRINENEQIARVIMIKILMKGIKAQPFFFPQLPIAQAELNKNLKEVVKRALEK